MAKLTVADLQQMKRDGKKIAAAITYDYQMAQIMDRAGIDILTVGDSIGRNRYGHDTHHEVTVDQMVDACRAVAKGAKRAVVSCDMPFGPPQRGADAALEASIRLVKEGHAEMVKVDNAPANLDVVRALVRAGIPAWTQFGFSPQSSLVIGDFNRATPEMVKKVRDQILRDAKALEEAGASLLDLTHVTPDLYRDVSTAVSIPVLGGSTHAGPDADGRISGFSYSANTIDSGPRHTVNLAAVIYGAAQEYVEAVKERRAY
ncbi:MAG: 3-methyl-2-oxobutanoate hydroxymethyltransferase [Chloroflexi bacterium]|nr:3-methyl-2-oxobutanoate hydroxymethyltransferase [Chloroflexota bacterium]